MYIVTRYMICYRSPGFNVEPSRGRGVGAQGLAQQRNAWKLSSWGRDPAWSTIQKTIGKP